MATPVNDISSRPVPGDSEPRSMGEYRYFKRTQSSLLRDNALAYTNKRRHRRGKFSKTSLRKILRGATFIPAHANRYTPGEFRVENMKYFVVHRGGTDPKACNLLNLIRTFSFAPPPGKAAATHFIIGLNGELVQMVDLQDIAPHVGGSTMPDGKKNGNHTSVGVELEGAIGSRFTFAQYLKLAEVISTLNDISGFLPSKKLDDFIILTRRSLDLVSHSEIYPERKIDPGLNFNYSLLASLIQKVPATATTERYQPPIDALTAVAASLQVILEQAANPESAAETPALNAMSADVIAAARQLYMASGNNENIANWAAGSALAQEAGIEARVAQAINAMARLSIQTTGLPASSVYPTLDYDSGKQANED